MITNAGHTQGPIQGPEPAEAGISPVAIVNRGLRGRYPAAIALGTLFAIPAAIIGYASVKPVYASKGEVYIKPVVASVIYQDQNQTASIYSIDSFVSAQAALIAGARVRNAAVEDQRLIAAGWPRGIEGQMRLKTSTQVTAPRRGSTNITVIVEDHDARLAKAAANSLMRAYEAIWTDDERKRSTTADDARRQRLGEVESQVRNLENQIAELTHPLGIAGLQERERDLRRALTQLDSTISLYQRTLLGVPQEGGTENINGGIDRVELENLLGQTDKNFEQLLDDRRRLETELRLRLTTLTEDNPRIRRIRNDIEQTQIEIDRRIAEAQADGVLPLANPNAPALLNAQQLERELTKTQEQRESTNKELTRVSDTLASALKLQATLDQAKTDASLVRDRYERERVEKTSDLERVVIQEYGDDPLAPAKDRRVPIAIAAASAGMGLGMAIVWIYGFIKGSMRYITEVDGQVSSAQLLGSLPLIEEDDPESRELAEMSIHYLRNLLVSRKPRQIGQCTVYTLTSPSPGDGKTSVTLSLGVSFAVSDHKVLLLDSDLIGRGLTTDLRARGEPGLSEALNDPDPRALARKTQVPNLDLLPAGADEEFPPERLSAEAFRDLVESLRRHYDIILIDTGPILGSLEANIACISSDETILIVGRGQRSRMFHAAVERIKRIGAHCAGVVFNRAIPDDFARSVTSVSIGARSVGVPAPTGGPDHTKPSLRSLFITRLPDLSGSRKGSKGQPAATPDDDQ